MVTPKLWSQRFLSQFVALACLCCLMSSLLWAQSQKENLDGYAEFNGNGMLIVEGQRVRVDQRTIFKRVAQLEAIPLGYEVKVKGLRQADGTILAQQIEAKPNGVAMFEKELRTGHSTAEDQWMQSGARLRQAEDGSMQQTGRIVSDGPRVERLRRILNRLLPSYVDAAQVRVRIIEDKEWNASAMANGAIWVHSSLERDMNDDELAVILGHEIAHFTHEHGRRNAKQALWAALLAVGTQAALEKDKQAQAQAQGLMNLALGTWLNGYNRNSEDQADRVGMRYAYQGGFDVVRGSRVWERFRERYGDPDVVQNFFQGSHSRPSDRLRNLNREIRLNYSK